MRFLLSIVLFAAAVFAQSATDMQQMRSSQYNQNCQHTNGVVDVSSPTAGQQLSIGQTVSVVWTFHDTNSTSFNIGFGDASSGNFANIAINITGQPSRPTTFSYQVPSQIEGMPLAADGTTQYAFSIMENTIAMCGSHPINAQSTSGTFVLSNQNSKRKSHHHNRSTSSGTSSTVTTFPLAGVALVLVAIGFVQFG